MGRPVAPRTVTTPRCVYDESADWKNNVDRFADSDLLVCDAFELCCSVLTAVLMARSDLCCKGVAWLVRRW